jgi:8-oxo-dGTP diphosphatase
MGQAGQTIVSGQYLVSPRTLSFITRGDDVLLLRGASDKRTWPNQYNGVGGHVRPDEDVFTAARREIAEETGLQVQDLRLRGVINIPVDRQDAGVLLFVFTATSATADLRPSDEGIPEWVRRDAIDQVDLVEDLHVLLPHVLAMGPEDRPFFALHDYDESNELVATFASITA